jgi:cytochrome c oxidase cbb3-type subunit 3
MFSGIKKSGYILVLLSVFLFGNIEKIFAEGPPKQSSMNSTLAVFLVALAFLLLICIGILANILLFTANQRSQKELSRKNTAAIISTFLFVFVSSALHAQNAEGTAVKAAVADSIGGMSLFAFYMLMSVIFLELLIIVVMLLQIKTLMREETLASVKEARIPVLRNLTAKWWDKLNSFRPADQEADIDLGHDYDGIRELDNRLPPWWLYGFYLTIIAGCIYFYRYQVSHTGLSNVQEYEASVIQADLDIKEYLAKKGESVDENTVAVLKDPADLDAGKTIFMTICATCHKPNGAGDVGPNLTDQYWLHGGGIKNIFKTIRYGAGAMPQWQNSYSNKQIAQIASYVKSLGGTNPAGAKAPQGEIYQEKEAPADSTGSVKHENKITASN